MLLSRNYYKFRVIGNPSPSKQRLKLWSLSCRRNGSDVRSASRQIRVDDKAINGMI